MATKKQRRKATPPAAVPGTSRAQQRSGPRPSQLQRDARLRASRRETRRRAAVTGGVALLMLAAVAAFVVVDRRGDARLRSDLTAGSCEVDSSSDPTGPAGQNHVPAPSYAVKPPAGGDHLASAARAGVYTGTSSPEDGLLVHSLEHGYVVAWHRPDLPDDQLGQLTDFQARHDRDVIVVERSDLPAPVVTTAWGNRLLCQQVEPGPLERFFDEHVGKGPEDVPRG